jgi:peptidoglycan hydrolase FlgJ
MAIKPSSDIVLEVLRAADPQRAQATANRLTALGGGSVAAADDFAKILDAAEPSAVERPESAPDLSNMRARLSGVSLDEANAQKAARTEVDFEASMLKTFVDAILPKDEADIYGQGSAGDIWKSMFADQIARQIAKSGAFGISKKLFATHPLPGQSHAAAPSLPLAGPSTSLLLRRGNETTDPLMSISSDAALRHEIFPSPVNNRS